MARPNRRCGVAVSSDRRMTALEKAARAGFVATVGDANLWPSLDDEYKQDYRELARAVLMAVREPSRSQQLALMRAVVEYPAKIHDGEVCTSSAFFERSWPMQIDAILAEGEEGK